MRKYRHRRRSTYHGHVDLRIRVLSGQSQAKKQEANHQGAHCRRLRCLVICPLLYSDLAPRMVIRTIENHLLQGNIKFQNVFGTFAVYKIVLQSLRVRYKGAVSISRAGVSTFLNFRLAGSFSEWPLPN